MGGSAAFAGKGQSNWRQKVRVAGDDSNHETLALNSNYRRLILTPENLSATSVRKTGR